MIILLIEAIANEFKEVVDFCIGFVSNYWDRNSWPINELVDMVGAVNNAVKCRSII